MSSTETFAPLASPDKSTLRRIFDSIAPRYDFLNAFLSLNLDEGWRKRSRDLAVEGHERSVLDLGVGTGRFLRLFSEALPEARAIGLDFSAAMLRKAREDFPRGRWVEADFHDLPFQDQSFDLVISSFTLRSVKDMPHFLAEVHRLLASKGKAAFLCLTRPKNPVWRGLYFPYLKFYLPLMGRLLTGNPQAYQFLSQSIRTFQDPAATAEMMGDAGFREVRLFSFSWGCATLFLGQK